MSVRVKLAGVPASRSASELNVKVPVRLEAMTWLEDDRLYRTPARIRWLALPGSNDISSLTSSPRLPRPWERPELPPKLRLVAVWDPSSSADTNCTRPCGNSLNAAPCCELPER